MTNWRKYNGAIMPTLPPHVDVKETIDDISSFLIKSNAYLARWTTNFDCSEETEFWYVIKDTFQGLDELSSNTRKSIRSSARGSKPKKTSSYRGSLAKGGLVYNVNNVHPEPDEVKMRGSNQTYNEVAGVVLRDEEDRIFKNKGGTVYSKLQERKQLALGGFASTIVKQLVKEAVKLSNKKGSILLILVI